MSTDASVEPGRVAGPAEPEVDLLAELVRAVLAETPPARSTTGEAAVAEARLRLDRLNRARLRESE